MPEEVHNCVKDLLSKDDFYPELDADERESRAWGVCQKRHSSEGSLIIGSLDIDAELEGDILMFKGARVCHQGENKNGDVIPVEEIPALASTIAGKPIDFNHDRHDIRGVFVAGRDRMNTRNGLRALDVDGIIWADRFGDSAAEVQNRKLRLSIEAVAKTAECSVCGSVFGSPEEYCEHLLGKKTGKRILRGLRSTGGALTYRPADADAGFDDSKFVMVAFHQEAVDSPKKEDVMSLEEKVTELEAQVASLAGNKSELESRLAEMTSQLEQATAKVTELEAGNQALTASVDELKGEVAAKTEERDKLLERVRRNALKATLSDEEWEQRRETIMAMDEGAFELMASIAAKNVPPAEKPNIDLEGGGGEDVGGGDPTKWEIA